MQIMERAEQGPHQLIEHPDIKPSKVEKFGGDQKINPDLEAAANKTREKVIAELGIKLSS